MHRYKTIAPLGEHSYSIIVKAENLENGEIVAIKQMKKKFYTWQECMTLREIKLLRILQHPNIMKLKEIIRNKDDLYLVFEHFEDSLFKYYQTLRDSGKKMSEAEIKNILFQIATAMQYIHKMGFFHRDLTPENIFIDKKGVFKLGHFNNAREINARPPLTDYISTRWYRAPEQLLHSFTYNYKIDSFAIGCIFAELILMGPIFSGSSEVDQLQKICYLLGTPSHKDWPEYSSYLQKLKINIPEAEPKNFSIFFPESSPEAIDLLKKLLVFNPNKRWSCAEIIKHPFFTGGSVAADKTVLSERIDEFSEDALNKSNSTAQPGRSRALSDKAHSVFHDAKNLKVSPSLPESRAVNSQKQEQKESMFKMERAGNSEEIVVSENENEEEEKQDK